MTRKRFKKLIMARGYGRNYAEAIADEVKLGKCKSYEQLFSYSAYEAVDESTLLPYNLSLAARGCSIVTTEMVAAYNELLQIAGRR